MEILIDLLKESSAISNLTDNEKKEKKINELNSFLSALDENGFEIREYIGTFVFDANNQRIIDASKNKTVVKPSIRLAEAVLNNISMIVIFTDQKYVVFDNTYFLAIHLGHLRKIRPLSIENVNNDFEELIINQNQTKLQELYLKSFNDMQGEDAEPTPLLLGVDKPLTQGYFVKMKSNNGNGYDA